MGLEAVELVMELEDEFSVKLPDAECSRVRTVADLAALIIANCTNASPKCPTSARFYALRRTLLAHEPTTPHALRPSSLLADVLPRGARRVRTWRALRNADPFVPSLRPSEPADGALLALAVIAFFGSIAFLGFVAHQLGVGAAVVLTVPLLLALTWVSTLIQHACSREFPVGCTTVADLIRSSMPPEIPSERGKRLAFEQRILERTREIVSEQLSVPLDRVRPESRLVEDLEID